MNFFFFIIIPFASFSQSDRLTFNHLGVKEGMPEGSALDILQDSQGYIWISTLNGLVKFDGYDFTTFRPIKGDSIGNSPVGRSFENLLESKDGKIWVNSLNKGISSYNPQTEQFDNYSINSDTLEDFDILRFRLLEEDDNGNIWIFTSTTEEILFRISRLNPQTKEIIHLKITEEPITNYRLAYQIREDSSGYIWYGVPDKGLYRFDEKLKRFELKLAHYPKNGSGLKSNQITYFDIDHENNMWISTQEGLDVYDLNTQTWISVDDILPQKSDFLNQPLQYAYWDNNKLLWIYTQTNVLYKYDPRNKSIDTYELKDLPTQHFPPSDNGYNIRPVTLGQSGIWFGVDNISNSDSDPAGFLYYDYHKNIFEGFDIQFNNPENESNTYPYSYLVDRTDAFWVGNATSGINYQNPTASRIRKWKANLNDPTSFPLDTVFQVLEGRDKHVWISGNNGLAKFDSLSHAFQTYKPSNQNGIKLFDFLEDSNKQFWIGSNVGLYTFHLDENEFELFISNADISPYQTVMPELIDHLGRLWISYVEDLDLNHRGLSGVNIGRAVGIVDTQTGKILKTFEYDASDSTSLVSPFIRKIVQDSKKRIWLESLYGLCRYDEIEQTFIQYKHDPSDSTSVSGDGITFTVEDGKGRVWVGTHDAGLNLYNEKTDSFLHFQDDYGFNTQTRAVLGVNNDLWINTYMGEGLYLFDTDTRTYRFYNKSSGLPSVSIFGSNIDNKGNLWIITELGLSYFNADDETFTVYKEKDGFSINMSSQSFNPLILTSGDVWINNYDEVYYIQPAKLFHKDTLAPQTLITSLQIGDSIYRVADKLLLENHISNTTSLNLAYHQNDLTFEFVGLHYARPADNQYSYMLENFDADWSEPSDIRKAKYTDLPPGDYTFRVKASNADGVWNKEGASIQIFIAKPWWETVWAYMIFDITGRFIPNDFIRSLGHERITEVQLGDQVERVVSVLFTDIRNYTSLSETMTPEDNFRFINGYTNRMGPIIYKHKGFVNQYLGDGIMAIFQHKADDALLAMIEMQVKLRQYNKARIQKKRPFLGVGMGLHTGPLIMGIIGDERRTDAATISDTVNTAARMEGLTKTFGARILLSGSSYHALEDKDKFQFRYVGKVQVKGKKELLDVYECLNGDPEEEMALKWSYKAELEKAVFHLQAKEYEAAKVIIEKLNKLNHQDKALHFIYKKALSQKNSRDIL